MNHDQINVGLLGLGTVGTGVAKYFLQINPHIDNIILKKIAVANKHKKREIDFPHITTNAQEIFDDPDIHIVVELIGGINPPLEYIREAIKKGKHVVTANKAVLAKHSKELFDASRKHNVDLAYEASVGGGIPIIRILNGLKGEKVQRIIGILNGTTNFILTRMEEGLDFGQALKFAQKKGFAEANHVLDTGGFDARDKLALLAMLVYDVHIDPNQIECSGITDITPVDIDFARNYRIDEGGNGYAVKLLAIADRANDKTVKLRVHPALIPRNHPLASIRDEFNAVYIEGELAGQQMYTGRGAGRNATTSAVISDIRSVTQNIRQGIRDELPHLNGKLKVSTNDGIERGYIRMNLKHIPGSLATVTGILARHGLNIVDSIQQRKYAKKVNGGLFIPDIITFEKTQSKVIQKALGKIETSNRVHGKPVFLPFEE